MWIRALYVVTDAGRRRTPRVMAGFAGIVHGRQSAASAKNDCHSKCNNQWALHGETHYDPAPEPSVNRAPYERAVNIGAGLWSQSLKLLDLVRPHYDCGLFSSSGIFDY
jgi:hypothetical protein